MTPMNISIFSGTLYMMVYAVAVIIPGLEKLSEVLWLFSPLMIILIAILILKDKKVYHGKRYDEYFYQDEDIRKS